MRKARSTRKIATLICLVAALAMTVGLLASCSSTGKQASKTSSGTKLPPGVTPADVNQSATAVASSPESTSPAAAATTAPASTAAATPSASGDLVGARFTVVHATRPNTNKSAISSSAREVPGDYLEVELTILNTGNYGVVDLSQYSFRLTSPGIAADTYANYYGTNGTFGKYVSANEISGTLLSYSDLQPVAYKVKVGELVDKVFLLFDLNPQTNAPNAGVTKANSQLIIYKSGGTNYGTQVSIPLTGYPD